MTQLTRQDVQNIIDGSKGQIIGKLVSKQDVQIISDNGYARMASYLHNSMFQNQQTFLRQLDVRNAQYTQRLTAMESRVVGLEQEIRTMRQLMEKMVGQRPQQIIMPVSTEVVRDKAYRLRYNPT